MRYTLFERQRDVVILLARILLMLLFVTSGWGKLTAFSGTVGYFTSIGAPLPSIAASVAVLMEFGVGILLLIGFYTRPLAVLMSLFVLGTALIGHHFWDMVEPAKSANTLQFFKNMSIIGGLLLLSVTGPGRYSLDRRYTRHPSFNLGIRQPGPITTRVSTEGQTMTNPTETAILAGGCFWGMQDLLRRYPGVLHTRVGYSGGDVPNATYRNHGNHAEAIEIEFDPAVITYRQILEFFFQIHDPSTPNRQGNDVGPGYRSAIYYLNEQQRDIAEDTAADVDASKLWPGRVVTEIEPAGPFWQAEPEHQDYLERIPNGYTCHFIRPNWKLPKRGQE